MLIQGATVQFESQYSVERNKVQVTKCWGAVESAAKGGNPVSKDGKGEENVTGVVKVWFDEKGFGFIAPDQGGDDVFVHRNSLGEGVSLQQGNSVSFNTQWNA